MIGDGMKTFILISGATGGLGSAFVFECARRGYSLYLTDFREEVKGFGEYVSKTFNVQVESRTCDLSSQQSRSEFFCSVKAEGRRFWGLINVAGTDYEGAFLDKPRDQILQLIHLNVESTVDMTHEIIKLRDPDRKFMLINVCSLAAISPMPYKATYAATKRFLLDFSRALQEEIKDFGTVTALCPAGLPTTPETMERIFAQGFWGKITTVDTRSVARKTIDHAMKGHVVFIPGWINQVMHSLSGVIPVSLLTRLVGNRWRSTQKETNPWQEYIKSIHPV
jgi:short-subunit dehydrogenase